MMNKYHLVDGDSGQSFLNSLQIAETFSARLMGLMGKTLKDSEGLLIRPCNSIHCFFMKIPIDVVFLNNDNVVIHRIDGMKPWSVSPIIKNAALVIEANTGALKEITIGMRLSLKQI